MWPYLSANVCGIDLSWLVPCLYPIADFLTRISYKIGKKIPKFSVFLCLVMLFHTEMNRDIITYDTFSNINLKIKGRTWRLCTKKCND